MRTVRFHREGDEELLEARTALEVDHAIRHILENPLWYPQGRRGERRFVLDRFPYTILYRIKADSIFITAVAHQSRRPGYWRHRK